MKEISISKNLGINETIQPRTNKLKDYLFEPLKSGLFGFAIFFTILLAVKLFSYAIGTYNYFTVEVTDIELSLIGFVLLFLIRELENFKEDED